MAEYHTFTMTRSTSPDLCALVVRIRAAVNDVTAGLAISGQDVMVKKTTVFTDPEIAAAQAEIESVPALTSQRSAQNELDNASILIKAIVLALIDTINLLRTQPTQTFAAVTPAQVLQAIRDKAATL